VYRGKPVTAGFRRIRVAGESIACLLVLEDGRVATGDCAAIQYSGAGGRDPLFLAESYLPILRTVIRPRLEGMEVTGFRSLADTFEGTTVEGKPLHAAIRYGLSQALLEARALVRGVTRCEVLCEEYGLPVVARPVRIFGQSGDHRYDAVDRMILKQVDVLPHGLINNLNEKVGRDGGKLRSYVRWIAERIRSLRADDTYRPSIHIDVYGTVGDLFAGDLEKVAGYLTALEGEAGEFPLYVEGPVDMQERQAQIETMAALRSRLEAMGSRVKIVADEWCNSVEDVRAFTDARACHMVQIKTPVLGGIQNTAASVLYVREHGIEAYQGGTCNETDVSARTCVHVALAARPSLMLAKPGMGFDEGFTCVYNEMQRTLALLAADRSEETND
jgi:methylaspartate ammonia-lyase